MFTSMKAALTTWARRAKREVLTVYYAARDPRTPWWLRALALGIAAYALSPLDLVPDFIPVLGLLDDLLLVPLGLVLVLRLLPPAVLEAARAQAAASLERPRSRAAAAVIVALWLLGAAAVAVWLLRGIR
jgi:uncharacterized membrane protein YkvA (DUF1232 family)